jgi:hypothetical protein
MSVEERSGLKQDAQPELVAVFDTQQESEAQVVHGLLTSAGIESVVASLDATQSVWPGVGGVVVRVNAEQADEARKMIEDYKNAPDINNESDEGGSNEAQSNEIESDDGQTDESLAS